MLTQVRGGNGPKETFGSQPLLVFFFMFCLFFAETGLSSEM
jgi:hypothetical protein